MKNNKKTCECCGKELEISFALTKYCSSCSIYTQELKQKIHFLKRTLKKYKEKYLKLKQNEIKRYIKGVRLGILWKN